MMITEMFKRRSPIRGLLSCLLLSTLLSAPAMAQVVNGDFENLAQGWQWNKKTTSSNIPPIASCRNQALGSWTPDFWSNFPTIPSRGRVAYLRSDVNSSTTWAYYCNQASQIISLPTTPKDLTFNYQLGNIDPSYTITSFYQTVTLEVLVQPLDGSAEELLWAKSGTSARRDIAGNCFGCPTWHNARISLLKYAGKQVRLRFISSSKEWAGGSLGGYAQSASFIDSVGLVDKQLSTQQPTSGSWYNPVRSGAGLNLSKDSSGARVLTWYTFLPNGNPIWYVTGPAQISGGLWRAPLYKTTYNQASNAVQLDPAGDVQLAFYAADQAMFSWDLLGNGDLPPGQYDGSQPAVHLWGGESYTGQWYDPLSSGWGFNVDYQHGYSGQAVTAVTMFYYEGSEPVWALGAEMGEPTGAKTFSVNTYVGPGLCPGCTGAFSSTPTSVGTIVLDLNQSGYGSGYTDLEHNGFTWKRGSSKAPIGFSRLTQ